MGSVSSNRATPNRDAGPKAIQTISQLTTKFYEKDIQQMLKNFTSFDKGKTIETLNPY